jgi:hypothetical protein
MAIELSTEFKTAFGRMLVGLKMAYSIPNSLNYSETLIEYTRGGLYVQNKFDEHKMEFKQAELWYKEAISLLRYKGRNEFVQEQILSKCFDINNLIFPIALKEGVLVMNEEMFSVQDMFLSAPPPSDNQYSGRRR